jgi:hypothetical protein
VHNDNDVRPIHIHATLNDIEISDMQFYLLSASDHASDIVTGEEGHMALNWKKFITAFFAEEMYIRRHISATPSTIYIDLHELVTRTKTLLARDFPTLLLSDTVSIQEQAAYVAIREKFIVDMKRIHYTHYEQRIDDYEGSYAARIRRAYFRLGLEPPSCKSSLTLPSSDGKQGDIMRILEFEKNMCAHMSAKSSKLGG